MAWHNMTQLANCCNGPLAYHNDHYFMRLTRFDMWIANDITHWDAQETRHSCNLDNKICCDEQHDHSIIMLLLCRTVVGYCTRVNETRPLQHSLWAMADNLTQHDMTQNFFILILLWLLWAQTRDNELCHVSIFNVMITKFCLLIAS